MKELYNLSLPCELEHILDSMPGPDCFRCPHMFHRKDKMYPVLMIIMLSHVWPDTRTQRVSCHFFPSHEIPRLTNIDTDQTSASHATKHPRLKRCKALYRDSGELSFLGFIIP